MKMIKLLSGSILVFAVSAHFVFAEESADTGKLQTVKVNAIKEFNADKLSKKVPFDTDKLIFNTYYFKPRQILPLHKHPVSDELFYIVQGTGEFTVGSNSVIVGPTSAVYGPTGVFHGLVNSGNSDLVLISVQAPKPVETVYAENASVVCSVCKQEVIVKADAKEGDIYICPRCGAKLRLSKGPDGKWIGTQV